MFTFRLIHISDLHIGAVSNLDAKASLARRRDENGEIVGPFATHDSDIKLQLTVSLSDLQRRRNVPPHAIILTGDLATTGYPEDLKAAFEYVDGELQAIARSNTTAKTIDLEPTQIVLMPGNHDRYGVFGAPGKTDFEDVFDKYWPQWKRSQRTASCTIIRSKEKNETLAIICLDLSLGEEHQLSLTNTHRVWGQGEVIRRLHEPIINALVDKIRVKFPNACIVLATHFCPLPNVPDYEALRDVGTLHEIVKANGVQLILCGHTHKNIAGRLSCGCRVWTAGSACQFAESGHWINEIFLGVSEGSIVEAHRLRYKFLDGRFDYVDGENWHSDKPMGYPWLAPLNSPM